MLPVEEFAACPDAVAQYEWSAAVNADDNDDHEDVEDDEAEDEDEGAE